MMKWTCPVHGAGNYADITCDDGGIRREFRVCAVCKGRKFDADGEHVECEQCNGEGGFYFCLQPQLIVSVPPKKRWRRPWRSGLLGAAAGFVYGYLIIRIVNAIAAAIITGVLCLLIVITLIIQYRRMKRLERFRRDALALLKE